MEVRTQADIDRMEDVRIKYEAYLKHEGIKLRNAEDNYGNVDNQPEKLVFRFYDVITLLWTSELCLFRKKKQSGPPPSDAPKPKAKGRGEMLKRNAPPPAPAVESPILNLPSHHEKVAPKPVEKVAPPENNTASGKVHDCQ